LAQRGAQTVDRLVAGQELDFELDDTVFELRDCSVSDLDASAAPVIAGDSSAISLSSCSPSFRSRTLMICSWRRSCAAWLATLTRSCAAVALAAAACAACWS
jgi:hypothetical protein